MPDDRSLIEKLQAMATQTSQSPHEAETARYLLERLQAGTARTETGRVLTRAEILGTEDVVSGGRTSRRVYWQGYWINVDEDEGIPSWLSNTVP